MDLYKHAFRLSPLVPSELVADSSGLARDIRLVDMRARLVEACETLLAISPEPVQR
jgi:hypothetical protein